MLTKQEILLELPFDFLLSFAFEVKLLKTVCARHTKKDLVHNLVRMLSDAECKMLWNEYVETRHHERTVATMRFDRPTANELREAFVFQVLRNFPGIIGQEFRLNGTRVDLVQFNGNSSAYEIKSKRDKISRLSRQLSYYSEVFDYVNVVLDGHPQSGLPEHVGIFEVERINSDLAFKAVREPEQSTDMSPTVQLSLLRLKELHQVYEQSGGRGDDCRSDMIDFLTCRLSAAEINEVYKRVVEERMSQESRTIYLRESMLAPRRVVSN
jgi:hypothetical protein